MSDGTAISALQAALNQSREAKRKLEVRVAELEAELKSLRAQQLSINSLIEQTEGALRRALFPGDPLPGGYSPPPPQYNVAVPLPPPPSAPALQPRYQSGYEERYAQPAYQASQPSPQYQPSYQAQYQPDQTEQIEEQIARVRRHEQKSNVRFNDFRIPQAATIILREAGRPLHVNDIYDRMADGGFEFRGQHQLITLAVSLSRSKRFRKVSPGTFELSPEFLAGQVA